jgi:hypothetical protein
MFISLSICTFINDFLLRFIYSRMLLTNPGIHVEKSLVFNFMVVRSFIYDPRRGDHIIVNTISSELVSFQSVIVTS